VFESIATFLFKYPPRVFERGDLVWLPVVPVALLVAGLVVALVVVTLATRRLRLQSTRARWTLGALRGLLFVLLLTCLLRPSLVVSSSVPQRNVLAVLLDDSRSMRLADLDGETRLDAMRRVLGDSTDLAERLAERFVLRFYRFAADAAPIAGTGSLQAAGTRTDLAAALEGARQELADLPVAGVVVVSDGADNAAGDLTSPLLGLQARRIPVYTVGVGRERFARDLGLERLSLPTTALAGAGVLADLAVRIRGVGGETTTITVEADGRVVSTESLTLPRTGETVQVPVRIPALAEGAHRITVRAAVLRDEIVTENNEVQGLLRVRPGPEKVLYLEGEPRPEFAFTRRAVSGDSALQVVGLLRSAPGKYLRLGVDDSLELASGFPTTREELFGYRALVLGSIEASFFTGDQLRMIADFVSRRGGGLLALGGRAALAEGGFAGTPVAEVLPVGLLGGRSNPDALTAVPLQVRLTAAGRAHPVTQLAGSREASAARWDSLPPVTTVNQLGELRPGATILVAGRETTSSTDRPVLAYQRFGRGMAAVLGVQDSWLWQMHASISVEDQTHEALWQQLFRWMLDEAPNRLDLSVVPERVGPGEPVTVQARVVDPTYLDVNDAAVSTRVTSPSGRTFEVPLEWTLKEDGTYQGQFVADEEGMYKLDATAHRGTDTTRSATGSLLSDTQGADVERAELRTPLLRRIAEETDGRYYPLAEASRLADDVIYTESGITVRDSRDLWDMPIVFLVLVGLLGAEWGIRRWWGLA
jgi:uncharacterized membrane protein